MILLEKSDHKIRNSLYYLGIDLGSSSVKVALVASTTGKPVGWVQEPKEEMPITALHNGWAEQDPGQWWYWVCLAIKSIKEHYGISEREIVGIGISYQMHGLVLVDQNGALLREAIIWCDSRAVGIGNLAYKELGATFCDAHLLNSPGNFTASKLRWVQENERTTYDNVHKLLLPGDYLAFRFSDQFHTTASGLSEGIFWDFTTNAPSRELLDYFKIHPQLLPEIVGTFSTQATVSEKGGLESGLLAGTPILYRAGDQPNNALSLNVFHPGEVAATGGTSGVVYAVTENTTPKECARVNHFAHVNHRPEGPMRIGKLLCINGAGIQYRWLRQNLAVESYEAMNQLADSVAVGADGLCILPFGNGAERMLNNVDVGSHILHLNLNRHTKAHLCRAALEGIAFSFVYGFEIMQSDGVATEVIRTGNDNLFRSEIFATTIATVLGKKIEIYETTGAIGAARACAISAGNLKDFSSFMEQDFVKTYTPLTEGTAYVHAYGKWKKELEAIINLK